MFNNTPAQNSGELYITFKLFYQPVYTQRGKGNNFQLHMYLKKTQKPPPDLTDIQHDYIHLNKHIEIPPNQTPQHHNNYV